MQIEWFLLKPVSPSVLFDTLMSLYGYAGGERATVSAGKVDRDSPLVSGIRVLLVEDNEVNQQVATELLESEGAKVTIANHGAEAVKILTQNNQPPSFDVVLMDLQMPEMDGIAATRLLRVQPHLKNLPIIAMTAHVMAEEVQRCLDAGMNHHVAKPIDPDSFFATLARWTRANQTEFQDASAKTTRAEDEISLPELGGVDVAVGLRRIGGNRRLYRELLEQFAEKQKSAGDRIAAAFESGDRNQAERLAHSLKGVAGNLGIDRIFQSAGNLEKAIRDSQSGVNEMIKELTSELDRQVQTIQERLTVASEIPRKKEGSQAADPVAVSKAMTRLRDLLKASDADAREAYTGLAELLRGRVDPLRLQALSAAVRAFNFETALVELNEIAKQLGS
jgi:CheY-like chemotaxis protein/HPt (histidine-containing phosphotransfer) domain-containing protein